MTFLFSLLLFWIISVLFQTIKSLLKKTSPDIPDVPVPPPHFPLLRVPYVPLRRIIDFMDPDSLVSLSFCSQKSHSVIKTHRKVSFDGRLLIGGSDKNASFLSFTNYTFGIVLKRNQVLRAHKFVDNINYEDMELVKMGGQHVRVEVDHLHGYIISYWDNTVNGLKVITNYVTNLFNIDVSEIWASKQSLHIIEWVNRRQKTPLKNVLYSSAIAASEEEMIYILKDCRPISRLSIHLKPPQNFRFAEKFPKIDCLEISNSKWVTIDDLLSMDGIDIHLDNASLTNRCPRLKLFSAETGSVNILHVLDGLLHNAVLVENRRDYTSPFGYSINLSFGIDIQRAEGVTATVCKHENGILFIAVWPETAHNYN
ncbi:hypothetical protein CRE_19617 [Caenorhabditis remanei]|uniref:F-box domain-containing protein n=1 Tax=Caenorhabditis remanei TaxID=31234 RepID=E3NV03_CAERE|nr:hypothetical protein CRE_19617 [Caenorhabditis remanei]